MRSKYYYKVSDPVSSPSASGRVHTYGSPLTESAVQVETNQPYMITYDLYAKVVNTFVVLGLFTALFMFGLYASLGNGAAQHEDQVQTETVDNPSELAIR